MSNVADDGNFHELVSKENGGMQLEPSRGTQAPKPDKS